MLCCPKLESDRSGCRRSSPAQAGRPSHHRENAVATPPRQPSPMGSPGPGCENTIYHNHRQSLPTTTAEFSGRRREQTPYFSNATHTLHSPLHWSMLNRPSRASPTRRSMSDRVNATRPRLRYRTPRSHPRMDLCLQHTTIRPISAVPNSSIRPYPPELIEGLPTLSPVRSWAVNLLILERSPVLLEGVVAVTNPGYSPSEITG